MFNARAFRGFFFSIREKAKKKKNDQLATIMIVCDFKKQHIIRMIVVITLLITERCCSIYTSLVSFIFHYDTYIGTPLTRTYI